MSVHEDLVAPSSDSFWEINNFTSSVTRHENGQKLCSELEQMILDRANIEKGYAKSLRDWAAKWRKTIGEGPEYGTTEASWTAVFTEAEQVSDLHIEVKDNLLLDVQTSVKKWHKEAFHKSLVGNCKEAKVIEDDFKKAQKPWAKRYRHLLKTKKEFHNACKLEKTAINQENNARGDTAMSGDSLKKAQDKTEKCRHDVEASRERYEAALSDLNSCNAKYMEDMSEVFARAQESEATRMRFFKETFYAVRKAVDIGAKERLPEIFEQYRQTIDQADYEKDLKWWSKTHGIDMAMDWPVFEEYSPDVHSISRKDKKGGGANGDGITLTSIQKNESNMQPIRTQESYTAPTTLPQGRSDDYDARLNPFGDTDDIVTPPPKPPRRPPRRHRKKRQSRKNNGEETNAAAQNPFGDDDWEDYDNPLADDGAEGVPVRALYNYDGEEDDELSFKVGDVFVKLQDKDSQGWCKGRKDTKVGLYPDNYAEEINN